MIQRQGEPPYSWVPRAARYRDNMTGRFVKADIVRQWADASITATQDIVASVATGANENQGGWYAAMRDEIKGEYIRQYLAGIGGRNMMTQADWGRIGGMIADQYRYLLRFYAEVQSGELSEGEITMRSRMYINSAREAFARSSRISYKIAEYIQKRWTLGPKEHCENCPILAQLGWVDIDYRFEVDGREALPGNGATQCLTNCGCYLEFRK